MKKEDFLHLYKGGQRDFPGVDLSGMNLGDENLSNINLSGAILRKTDLCATNLENANLQNSDLREVELSADCHGHGIDFSGANFEGTGMYEGIIEKANFSQCNFIKSSFGQFLATECNFSKTDFTNSWLSETDFSGGNFNDAVFRKTYIDTSDIPPLTEEFFSKSRWWKPVKPLNVTVQVDPNTLAWFHAQGEDYEKKMAAALRIYAEAHKAESISEQSPAA